MARTLKNSAMAKAGVRVGDSNSRIHGNADNYVNCDDRGVTVSGPVSFVSMPNQIRFGGLWTMSNAMQLSLPSTMATPSPVLRVDLPVRQLAGIMKQVAVMSSLIGALGSI